MLGDYLLVARRAADLYAIGPYVARTLSAAPPPKEAVALEIPESALGGPILDEVREVRAKEEGAAGALVPLAGFADTSSRCSPTRPTRAPPSRSTRRAVHGGSP